MKRTRPLAERFWEKVQKRGPDDCWGWTGVSSPRGYGRIWLGKRMWHASQVSLELAGQPRPPGMSALHSCDNPPCCNPAHLRWGSGDENARDACTRGRQVAGERHPQAKLTEDVVAQIKAVVAAGGLSQNKVAARFGVSPRTIQRIRFGHAWANVDAGVEP